MRRRIVKDDSIGPYRFLLVDGLKNIIKIQTIKINPKNTDKVETDSKFQTIY